MSGAPLAAQKAQLSLQYRPPSGLQQPPQASFFLEALLLNAHRNQDPTTSPPPIPAS
ncbi:uncharacterized protein MYCFIDRAFT_179317 [Pseudocercospora fijiensis CIRAD86]|uniref:Uncharacterized protein n=1 Tax=Pseudocercospora fijiensis (strain CIRAD86) TaxID=383855 RepID=M3A0A5_PSEFD|nr:uncharacterized protein MYCFIDRAFT_179317 [Pseudocercospora fijiensis CIRAD86]EME77836.1 hypothetical protein MYCFIDRAFT_179317 [Pseudocercospora fijiensis CIRAD86]